MISRSFTFFCAVWLAGKPVLHRFGWPAVGVTGMTLEALSEWELKLKLLVLALTAVSVALGIVLQVNTLKK